MSHPILVAHETGNIFVDSWSLDAWVLGSLVLLSGIYVCGWVRLHRRSPTRFGYGRLAAFLGGMAAIAVALESPLHAIGARLQQAHMAQHLLLMMVAPPLLWMATPLQPLLQGLPRGILRLWVRPLLVWRPLTSACQLLVFPPLALAVDVGGLWAWHTPALYERALASESWHVAQHVSFLATSLAFWWPVVQPWPSRPPEPRWALVLYLLLADLQNTVLSAWFVFSERLIYPSYATVLPVWGLSALNDQAAAGAIMWVPGSIAYLMPMVWIVLEMLNPTGPQTAVMRRRQEAVSRMR